MFEKLKEFSSTRTKPEWRAFAQEKWTDSRIWIQEHGEYALLVGMAIGLLFILFFKLVVGLLALAFLACLVVLELAPDSPNKDQEVSPREAGTAGSGEAPPSSKTSPETDLSDPR